MNESQIYSITDNVEQCRDMPVACPETPARPVQAYASAINHIISTAGTVVALAAVYLDAPLAHITGHATGMSLQ